MAYQPTPGRSQSASSGKYNASSTIRINKSDYDKYNTGTKAPNSIMRNLYTPASTRPTKTPPSSPYYKENSNSQKDASTLYDNLKKAYPTRAKDIDNMEKDKAPYNIIKYDDNQYKYKGPLSIANKGIKAYKKGGKVKATGLAYLHKGEKVIPAAKVKALEKMKTKKSYGPSDHWKTVNGIKYTYSDIPY